MSVIVKDGRVRFEGKTYEKGSVITGLSKKDEARLISKGVVTKHIQHIISVKDEKIEQTGHDVDEDIKENNYVSDAQGEDEKIEQNESEDINEFISSESLGINFNPDECITPPKKARK